LERFRLIFKFCFLKVSIEEEKEKIKEYFDLFDRDGDGLINASELQEVLFAYEGIKVTDDEVNSFVSFIFFQILFLVILKKF